jgi:RsiW-degrading membrane proteinase PrsW (M82 family)
MNELTTVLILILLSFLPAIVYLTWVRRTERYNEEAWWPLLKAFAVGAIISTVVSAILESVLYDLYSSVLQPDIGILPNSSVFDLFLLSCVIAPIIEEGMKGIGVYGSREEFRYVADGLVFGAAVGFGFGFVENSLYGLSAYYQAGFAAAIATLFVRALSSILLHGSSTAMTGFGVAENRLHEGRGHILVGYYFLAVLMHASFNLLLILPYLLPTVWVNTVGIDLLTLFTLILAITYALAAFHHIRERIAELQFQPIASPTPMLTKALYSSQKKY